MTGLRTNPCLAAIASVLDDARIPYRVRHGGKHPKVVFRLHGMTIKRAFPASSSDYRSPRNAQAQVRRLVRSLERRGPT